jgi:CheY-like chemotaxis protein
MAKKQLTRILVVEDEKIVAMDVKNMLENLGYTVPAIASSGGEALQKIEEIKPDIVLMDIMLDDHMDGVETTHEIRSRFAIPVVYVTAYADENTLERAKTTAPYGYILKPFEEKELHTTIQIALYKHELEKKIREETENSLATIIGGAELILEEGPQKHDPETLRRVELIRKAAYMINETIEKL